MPVDVGSETNIKIGSVLYDNKSHTLIDPSGEEIYLRSQSAMVLKHLVLRLNELVTRDDLIDSVWGHVAVTNDSLTQCIADIRKALMDNDKSILCTIPKRGYRLIGTMTQPAQAYDAVNAANPVPVISVSDSEITDPYAARLDPRDILPTLAVLPFRTVNDDEAKVFSSVLGNEITRQLCSFPDINVISSFSTGLLGGDLTDPDRILTRLNADFILTGNLVTRGSDAVVSLEFLDTSTEFVLWSDRIQLDYDPMCPEIAEANLIVNRIRRAIMRNEILRVASRPLGELKRFSLLYGAVGLMYRFSPNDFMSAKSLLDHLIEQAPQSPCPACMVGTLARLEHCSGLGPYA